MGGIAFALLLMMIAGGDDDEGAALPDGVRPPPDEDDDLVFTGMKIPPVGEPDVDWVEPPVIPPDDDGMSDAEWLAGLAGLVSEVPKQNTFWMVRAGTTASQLARDLLAGVADTNANRVRLIKCLTMVPWNRQHYASTGGEKTWGTLYNIDDGTNLSAAWMPRHPSAMQELANRMNPVRGIDEGGGQVGVGGYYGLLWIPPFTATQQTLACNGGAASPPPWLMQRIGG